jgi:4-amino-4-deoxy-L-arabinose transferase-like glycosyltransferase
LTGKKKYTLLGAIVFLLLLCYFTLFHQLGYFTLRAYDESRNAAHAIAMFVDGDYLIRSFEGRPDMWETKPPLLVWLQVFCIKLFGFDNWVYRLPSALAATATAFYIFSFLKKQTQTLWPGLLSAIILLTTQGYLIHHCARTADHDALLIFFEIAALISFYNYLQGFSNTLGWTVLYIILGVFTKSIAVFFIGPGMVLAMLISKKTWYVLSNKRLYIYGFAGIAAVVAYYLAREYYNSGYVDAVASNELWGRYLHTNGSAEYKKADSFWTYGIPMFTQQFLPWSYLILPAIAVLYIKRDNVTTKIATYFIINAVAFYLVVTFGTFKEWYALPMLPMLAIITGVGIYRAWQILLGLKIFVKAGVVALYAALLIVFSSWAYSLCFRQFTTHWDFEVYQYGYFFKHLKQHNPGITTFTTFDSDDCYYNGSLKFYITLYNKVYHYNIKEECNRNNIKSGMLVVSSNHKLKKEIEQTYYWTALGQHGACVLYRLNAVKNP